MELASETGDKICVLVVDDHKLFTSGLARIIGAQPDMEVLAEVHDGAEAVEICREEVPDVILMDVFMPGMDGIRATAEIRELLPHAAVLILTAHADDEQVFRGIRAGARGYVLKDCTPEEVAGAIRTVHAGDTIMAPSIARRMLGAFEEARGSELAPPLTRRELEVIRSLARGRSNREIAVELGIAEKTVRNHASNIYRKLHIFDRTQAVLYAIREGLVDAPGPRQRRASGPERSP
ncbi:MAG TPA: response regulator transcription factor [Rubrobacter sp.]|nr:response regulator transcription factor [Rubrobacter sp.]